MSPTLRFVRCSSLLLVALASFAVPGSALANSLGFTECNAKPRGADTAKARKHYLAGKEQLDAGRSKEAVESFRAAYMADCTKHDLLILLSFAYQADAQLREAVEADELYLEKKGKALPASDRQEIQARVDDLRARVRAMEEDEARKLELAKAEEQKKQKVVVVTSPPRESESPYTVTPWVVTGVGAAAVLAGAAMFVVGTTQFDNERCRGDALTGQMGCEVGENGQPFASKGTQAMYYDWKNWGGFVVMGAGAAVAAGGLVWHFLEGSKSSSDSKTAVRVTPSLGPQHAGLGVGGAF